MSGVARERKICGVCRSLRGNLAKQGPMQGALGKQPENVRSLGHLRVDRSRTGGWWAQSREIAPEAARLRKWKRGDVRFF